MMQANDHTRQLSEWIKARAAGLGFDACGISRAGKLEEDKNHLLEWLMKGYQGEMDYMAGHQDKRVDPRLLVEGARSVISVLLNYYPQERLPVENNFKISRYAYGQDYHEVIREKLNALIDDLRLKAESAGQLGSRQWDIEPEASSPGPFSNLESSKRGLGSKGGAAEPGIFRAFVDSAPVLDKAWAERAGLGWIGKNTCLIHPRIGSFVFVGEIITNLELAYDTDRVNDLCGGCNKCIEACPTGAIVGPRVLDARKCISYLTIEYKGELPASEKEKFHYWIFGCDICQEVCPWNRKARPHNTDLFSPSEELRSMNKEKWKDLTLEGFQRMFKGSAVKRTKFVGLKRNIKFVSNDG